MDLSGSQAQRINIAPSVNAYPNGLEIGNDDRLYVTEQDGSRLVRLEADGSNPTSLATLDHPNGVTFSPDYKRLYIGSFGGGTIHYLDFDDDGNPQGSPILLRDNIGMLQLDGMGVDACGNIYVTSYVEGIIYRISPDGSKLETLVDLPSEWIPNLDWGNGVGPWDKDKLYVIDASSDNVYELDIKVPEKPRKGQS